MTPRSSSIGRWAASPSPARRKNSARACSTRSPSAGTAELVIPGQREALSPESIFTTGQIAALTVAMDSGLGASRANPEWPSGLRNQFLYRGHDCPRLPSDLHALDAGGGSGRDRHIARRDIERARQ